MSYARKKVSPHSKKYKAVIVAREKISDRTEKQTDEEGVIYFITDGKRFNPDGDPSVIFPDTTKIWTDEDGKYHRDDDLPAIINPDSENSMGLSERWFQHGVLFRPNGKPSCIVRYSGSDIITYYWTDQMGKIHRDGDKPAVENTSGYQEWSLHGVLHREGDFPTICDPLHGKLHYHKHGRYHRENGPAITTPTEELWFYNGQYHRENGPAIIKKDFRQWYNHGEVTKTEKLINGEWVIG